MEKLWLKKPFAFFQLSFLTQLKPIENVRMVSKSITKKKTNEIIKRELLNSLQDNDDIEEQGLNETANLQEALRIINRYDDIIKTQNKKAIEYIGKQGELF